MARGTTSVVLEDVKRAGGSITEVDEHALEHARKLHRKVCLAGRLRRIWGSLTGVDRNLLDLENLRSSAALIGWSYIGIEEISIDRVIGSEGFSSDFDKWFFPLPGHDELRWLETAIGCLGGSRMPVIEVVQIDSVYYAQTGQYQLSVARAQGRNLITAYVTNWDIQGKVHAFI